MHFFSRPLRSHNVRGFHRQVGTVKIFVTSNGPFPHLLNFERNLIHTIFRIPNLLALEIELFIGLHANQRLATIFRTYTTLSLLHNGNSKHFKFPERYLLAGGTPILDTPFLL